MTTYGEVMDFMKSNPDIIGEFFKHHPHLIPASALQAAGYAINRPLDPLIVCPPVSEITAAQLTIFDNWPTGARVKGKPERYGIAVELWTAPSSDINIKKCQFKANSKLIAHKNIARCAATLREKGSITEEYFDCLMDVATQADPNSFVSLLFSKQPGRGTVYLDQRYLLIEITDGKVEVAHLIADGAISASRFSVCYPNGNRLKSPAMAQARLDLSDFSHSSWRTNLLD